MNFETRKIPILTVGLLILLIASELILHVKYETKFSELSTAIKYFFWLAGIPLFIVAFSIYDGGRVFRLCLGWVSISSGIFMQFVFYASNDPSKVFVFIISASIYWLCGVLALIAMSYGRT